jgi:uncharacterized protein YcbK (DUF882 family)
MARIDFSGLPTVEPSHTPLAYENIPTSPAMFGGLIGEAEQKLGQGVESAGKAGIDFLQAKQGLTNEIAASENNTWLARRITDRFNDFGRLQGRAAQDGLPAYKDDVEKLYKQSMEAAGDNLAMKAMLAKSGRYLTDSYYRYGVQHADTEWRKWNDKTAADRATEYGSQAAIAAQHGTWTDVDVGLNTSDDEVRKRYEAQGWKPDDITPETRKNRGVNVKHIVDALSNQGQTREAQAVFERYRNSMDAASIDAVTSHLNGRRRNEADRLQGNQVADEEYDMARRGLSSGMRGLAADAARDLEARGIHINQTSGYRSPEHNAAVGGARGSQHLHGNAIDVSLNGLTVEQQRAVVDRFLDDPRTGGFGYYPKSNSIHVDVRTGGRAAWGSDYTHGTIGAGWPDWLTAKVNGWTGSTAPRQAVATGGMEAAAADRLAITAPERPLFTGALNDHAPAMYGAIVPHDGRFYLMPRQFEGHAMFDPANLPTPDALAELAGGIGWGRLPSYATEQEAKDRYNAIYQEARRIREAGADEPAPATAGPVDRGDVYRRIVERTDGNPAVQAHAIARMQQRFSVEREERTANTARINRSINDSLAEAGETGIMHPVAEDDFVRNKAPGESDDDARVRYQIYREELQYHSEHHAMENMTPAEMRSLVEGSQPKADSPGGWAAAVKRHDRLQKSMDEVITKRRKDPAVAVAKDPAVVAALHQYDQNRPETFRPVAAARLAAQEHLGIPAEFRSPITHEEALQEAMPLWSALPGQEARTGTRVVERFMKMFGPNTDQALIYAVGAHHESETEKKIIAGLLRKVVEGRPITRPEARATDQRTELDAANRAASQPAVPPPAPPQQPGQPAASQAAPAAAQAPPAAQPRPAGQAAPQDAERERQHTEQAAERERQRVAQERQRDMDMLTRLGDTEAQVRSNAGSQIPANDTAARLDSIRRQQEEIFARHPDLRGAYEDVKRRRSERVATEKFTSEMDALAKQDANYASRINRPPQARKLMGIRENQFDADLARIDKRREFLVTAERERLGIRGAAPFTWPAEKKFPAAADISALLHNPVLAEQFDGQYGQGSAHRVLGR